MPTSTCVLRFHICRALSLTDQGGISCPLQISGSRDRNRALDGDTVAIELLDVDEVWASKKEKEDKKRKKEENASFGDARAGSQAAQWRSDKRKDDVEVEVRCFSLSSRLTLRRLTK